MKSVVLAVLLGVTMCQISSNTTLPISSALSSLSASMLSEVNNTALDKGSPVEVVKQKLGALQTSIASNQQVFDKIKGQ